ncbi:hypothetical protein UFOVP1454_14 [uncultured Caudovirales phage]|uniref:Uncharacterized protein n=1 Tax=uncultured Caudovirales phage TaxID=2100421 RepID=A0A6J5SI96_9CAUD|nr:hypothetical protein UFOVP1454_14 [uncultured Caudovirales phage]
MKILCWFKHKMIKDYGTYKYIENGLTTYVPLKCCVRCGKVKV